MWAWICFIISLYSSHSIFKSYWILERIRSWPSALWTSLDRHKWVWIEYTEGACFSSFKLNVSIVVTKGNTAQCQILLPLLIRCIFFYYRSTFLKHLKHFYCASKCNGCLKMHPLHCSSSAAPYLPNRSDHWMFTMRALHTSSYVVMSTKYLKLLFCVCYIFNSCRVCYTHDLSL